MMSRAQAKSDKKSRFKQPRTNPPVREPRRRVCDFREVYLEYDLNSAIQEASRCVECKDPPCEEACPLHNRIRDWLILTSEGKVLEAAALSRSTSNMPEVCGRICPQDRLCEQECIVGIKHERVAIGPIERFINEYVFRELGEIPTPRLEAPSRRHVAVIGSGPAGLACADELRKRGRGVTIFESLPMPGGLLYYGIPSFKLEKWIVERRIDYLERLGVSFVCNVKIGEDLSVEDLFDQGFDAVFLGTGAQRAKNPRLPGMELKGIHEALPFLIRNNLRRWDLPQGMEPDNLVGRKVVVFGGGDTAMDCLRTSVRLGASQVVCVYRRDEENMPGSRQEVKRAKEERVQFHFLTAPLGFIGDESGQVQRVKCMTMRLGEPDSSGRRSPVPVEGGEFEFEADFLILAFGFEGDPLSDGEKAVKVTKWGTYEIEEDKMTSRRGLFAGGDCVRGPDLLVTALKDGRDAAVGIDRYLRSLERPSFISKEAEADLRV